MTSKSDPPAREPILSPCTLVCSIDIHSGHCYGCGRTMEEIAKWSSLSNAECRKIMNTLAERLEKFESTEPNR